MYFAGSDVISIRKLLTEDEAQEPMLRAIHLLLQGIRIHMVEGAPADAQRFREDMNSVTRLVEEEHNPQAILTHAGMAVRVLQEYNQRTGEFLTAQAKELQTIVQMLTSTIGTIAKAGDENVRRLVEIEQQVFSASQLQDVRLVKSKLAECLEQIRQEAIRQREETSRAVDQLSQSMVRSYPEPAKAEAVDEVTKLPSRQVAEEALADACAGEKPAFAAALSVDRIAIYNIRFGQKVGDDVLLHFGEWVARRLRPEDRLFRWSGPALVVLLPRVNRIEIVREEMARVMDAPFEYTVQMASRGVLLPVTARWSVFPMMASARLLFHKIDSFVNLQRAPG